MLISNLLNAVRTPIAEGLSKPNIRVIGRCRSSLLDLASLLPSPRSTPEDGPPVAQVTLTMGTGSSGSSADKARIKAGSADPTTAGGSNSNSNNGVDAANSSVIRAVRAPCTLLILLQLILTLVSTQCDQCRTRKVSLVLSDFGRRSNLRGSRYDVTKNRHVPTAGSPTAPAAPPAPARSHARRGRGS